MLRGIITEKERVKTQGRENKEWCKFYRRWEGRNQCTRERHVSTQTKGKEGRWGMHMGGGEDGNWKALHLVSSIFSVEE